MCFSQTYRYVPLEKVQIPQLKLLFTKDEMVFRENEKWRENVYLNVERKDGWMEYCILSLIYTINRYFFSILPLDIYERAFKKQFSQLRVE